MLDNMNELVQHSPVSGKLSLEQVSGDTRNFHEAENEATAGAGCTRTMYAYAPVSGCPAPKQCQVLMVLRDGCDEASARRIMTELELDRLAEERHFILVFPNPLPGGWNYSADSTRENDMDYLIRCFAELKTSSLKVSGFNGMTFYLATSQETSAMLMTFAVLRPLNVPAIMLDRLPADYRLPEGALNAPVAAWSGDSVATAYIKKANHSDETCPVIVNGIKIYKGGENPHVRLLEANRPIDSSAVRLAWDNLFSETRRWQNDTWGTYQGRTNFTERGFVGHVKDTRLGVNNGFAHTWYEYIPPQLRGSDAPVPLLFYFHGSNCVPLYGAEQSGWHDIADKEGFIVVYPEASRNALWNVWSVAEELDDDAFILSLIEHMKAVHPIDESRIYVSGFSMGAMMAHAMASMHPDVFAAAAPFNSFHEGCLMNRKEILEKWQTARCGVSQFPEDFVIPSETKLRSDKKKAEKDYRMPIFNTSGLIDANRGKWPIQSGDDIRLATLNYWKKYNHIPIPEFVRNNAFESGLMADENFYDGEDQRFLHHRWYSTNPSGISLYEMFIAKRMPHALDIRTTGYAWEFMKKFSRAADGSLFVKP